METSMQKKMRQFLNSSMVNQVSKSPEEDHSRTVVKGQLWIHIIPSMSDTPLPPADLHHTEAWGEDMLVPQLWLPGVGLPLSP